MVRAAGCLIALATVVSGWLAVVPPTAVGAFAGRNGKLVVEPVSSTSGLLVVDPRSGRTASICTDPLLCGHPVRPRFSPDGRDLVFVDSRSRRVGIVAADGPCLWCLLGRPLSQQPAAGPAFLASGGAVTFGSAGGLAQVGLSGGPARRVLSGAVVDAVWSAGGRLAFVRRGSLWLAGPGKTVPQLLARGVDPSWSPDGSQIAVDQGESVWIVRASDGVARRLARGAEPAFSPDGRLLAFIGPGHALEVVAVGGGRPRRIAGVRGLSVDWQPLPRRASSSCTLGRGWQVISEDPEAVIASNPGTPFTPWYGCLRTLSKWHSLGGYASGEGYYTTLAHVALAGRFAAVLVDYTDKYMNCSNTITRYDLAGGRSAQLFSQDCSAFFGLGGVDSLSIDSSGFAVWRALAPTAHGSGAPVEAPSCLPCIAEQLYAHDDRGTRVIDGAPPGAGKSLANVTLAGDSLTLSWTHDGMPRTLSLR